MLGEISTHSLEATENIIPMFDDVSHELLLVFDRAFALAGFLGEPFDDIIPSYPSLIVDLETGSVG